MTRLLSPVLADFGKNAVAFWCPGCKGSHVLSVSGAGAIWGWNQNVGLDALDAELFAGDPASASRGEEALHTNTDAPAAGR